VLDAGCGGGHWLQALAGTGIAPERLHGVDILAGRLRRVPACPTAPSCAGRTCTTSPNPDQSFELVLLFTLLSSLASPDDVRRPLLAEARRVLGPNGRVLI
jgi:SAM-dependent methyltransferase